jgi:hypothetical protein
MNRKSEVVAYYLTQIDLAQDRIRLFESGAMSTNDIGPPSKDTTLESIEVEKALIENFTRGIEILRPSDAQRSLKAGSAPAT